MEKVERKVFMSSVKKGYHANGIFDGQGITVLEGSRIGSDWSYYSPPLSEKRHTYVDADHILRKNLYFNSTSIAASFVCGRSANGWTTWKLENGDELTVWRNENAKPAAKNTSNADEQTQGNADMLANAVTKEKIEKMLSQMCMQYQGFTCTSKKIHTTLSLNENCIANVYYRKNEIRVELQKGERASQIYNMLLVQKYIYQKPSADPNSTPGKYSFFSNIENAEAVLRTVMDKHCLQKDASDLNLKVGTEEEEEEPVREERKSISLTEHADNDQIKKSLPPQVNQFQGGMTEDTRITELFRQVAQLQEIVKKQQSTQTVTVNDFSAEKNVQENRYRIAMTRNDAPEIHVENRGKTIQNLAFVLTFRADENANHSGKFYAFFVDKNFEVVSNSAEFSINSGEMVNCRFVLASKMSKERICYLGVRDSRDVQDELLKLIPFTIEILFDADFGF